MFDNIKGSGNFMVDNHENYNVSHGTCCPICESTEYAHQCISCGCRISSTLCRELDALCVVCYDELENDL